MIKDLWYKNAVIYCVHVGAYMDSNGDGFGDFPGLTRRLDYIAGLGVTCIWLMPFQRSPYRDNGYDISDYYNVDHRYGTLGDFVDFMHGAQRRGIRVIIDLVVNHTSDQHPWFQHARRDKRSRYRDFYIWAHKKPTGAEKGVVFPGVQKTTWTRDKIAGQYYFHRFYHFQPDLNMQNPEVQEEIRKVTAFYLELGVSGFRMDALPFVIQTKGTGTKHVERYDMLRDMRASLQWRVGDAIVLAEANVPPNSHHNYFGEHGDRLHMMFNFWVNQHIFYALASQDTRPLAKALVQTRQRHETSQWAMFLRNHDELDLGRLSDDEREVVFERMGRDRTMQLYDRGIRRRLAPMLDGDRRRIELAYSLMFSLPGTPVLRYGDEIGMGENLRLKERNAVRTPMQWSAEPHAGFTLAKKCLVPVISRGPYGYREVNAAAQKTDPRSLLNWIELVIRARRETPELGWGTFDVLDTGHYSVLALRSTWRNNSVVTIHNFADEAIEIELRLGDEAGRRLYGVLAGVDSVADARGRHHLIMEPYGYRWFRVGGLNYLLDRAKA